MLRTIFGAMVALLLSMLSARDSRQNRAAFRMQFAPRLRDHDGGARLGQRGHDRGDDDVRPSGIGSESAKRRQQNGQIAKTSFRVQIRAERMLASPVLCFHTSQNDAASTTSAATPAPPIVTALGKGPV